MRPTIKKERIFPIRMDHEMHKQLRRAAFLAEIPMSEFIRLSIKTKLEETKKILTNAESIV